VYTTLLDLVGHLEKGDVILDFDVGWVFRTLFGVISRGVGSARRQTPKSPSGAARLRISWRFRYAILRTGKFLNFGWRGGDWQNVDNTVGYRASSVPKESDRPMFVDSALNMNALHCGVHQRNVPHLM